MWGTHGGLSWGTPRIQSGQILEVRRALLGLLPPPAEANLEVTAHVAGIQWGATT